MKNNQYTLFRYIDNMLLYTMSDKKHPVNEHYDKLPADHIHFGSSFPMVQPQSNQFMMMQYQPNQLMLQSPFSQFSQFPQMGYPIVQIQQVQQEWPKITYILANPVLRNGFYIKKVYKKSTAWSFTNIELGHELYIKTYDGIYVELPSEKLFYSTKNVDAFQDSNIDIDNGIMTIKFDYSKIKMPLITCNSNTNYCSQSSCHSSSTYPKQREIMESILQKINKLQTKRQTKIFDHFRMGKINDQNDLQKIEMKIDLLKTKFRELQGQITDTNNPYVKQICGRTGQTVDFFKNNK